MEARSRFIYLHDFYSFFSGISVYLFIPLLDILFHPEKAKALQTSSNDMSIPLGLSAIVNNMKQFLFSFIFQGTQKDALMKVLHHHLLRLPAEEFFRIHAVVLHDYAEEGVIKDIRNALYRHLHDLPLGYFSNERTGGLISRITNDVTLINGGGERDVCDVDP